MKVNGQIFVCYLDGCVCRETGCICCLEAQNKSTNVLAKMHKLAFIALNFQTTNENWTPSILNEAAKIIYKVMCFGFFFYTNEESK